MSTKISKPPPIHPIEVLLDIDQAPRSFPKRVIVLVLPGGSWLKDQGWLSVLLKCGYLRRESCLSARTNSLSSRELLAVRPDSLSFPIPHIASKSFWVLLPVGSNTGSSIGPSIAVASSQGFVSGY